MGITLSDETRRQIVEARTKAGRVFELMESEIQEAYERLQAAIERTTQQIAEAFAELKEEIAACIDDDEKAYEAQERRCARLLASQRAAARVKAYGLRMLLEKAHRALKRRKRLHDDGGVPDGERQAI